MSAMGHDQVLPDAELVRRVLTGRKEDFGVLVRRYLPALKALAYSKTGNQADAEEVTQEAFLKGFKYLDRLQQPGRFGAWMAAIVRNAALTSLRKRRGRPAPLHELESPQYSVEPDIESRDLRRFLREEVGKLDENHRDVLLLYYFAGLNTRQIAAILSISADAAQKRLQRARDALGNSILGGLKRELGYEAPAEKQAARVMGIVAATPVPWLGQGVGTSEAVSILPKAGAAKATAGGSLVMKGAAAIFVVAAAVSALWVLTGDSEQGGVQVAEAVSSVPAAADLDTELATQGEEESKDTGSLREPESEEETHSEDGEVKEVRIDPALAPRSIAPVGYPGTTVPDDLTDTVRGVVYDPAGAPLAEAKVWVGRFGMQARDTREVLSDMSGAFQFRLPPGQWRLQARKGLLGGEADTGFAGQFITAGKGKTIETRIRTERLGAIHGCVRDRDTRRPIPHAWLWTDNRARIETDAEGRYTIEGVRPKDHTMMVLAPGYKREYVLYCNVLQEEREVDVFLVPGGKVTGIVLDPSGRPLAHAWVHVPRSGSGCISGDYEVCDEHGQFEYDGLALGKKVQLRASVPLYVNVCDALYEEIEGRTQATQEIEIPDASSEPREVAFVLDPLLHEEVRAVREWERREPQAVVCGRVVDPLGSPVRNFRILFQVPHTPTGNWMSMEVNESCRGFSFSGKDGTFEVTSDYMVPGIVTRVVAAADGYGEAVCDLAEAHSLRNPPSHEVLVLRLSRPKGLSVRVREAGVGGRPVRDAQVAVLDWQYSHGQSFPWRDSFRGALRTASVQTDDEGWARFEDLPFDEGIVVVTKEGCGSWHQRWNVGESVVSAELAPECVIEGSVCDRNGNALDAGSVHLRTGGYERYDYHNANHGRFSQCLEQGSGGRFRFAGLPAGDYELHVHWVEPAGDTMLERGYDDAFTLEAGQALSVAYPEDSFAANPERWMQNGSATDGALKRRLLGTWTREWLSGDRRLRQVFHFTEAGRFEFATYREGLGLGPQTVGLFQVVKGELRCLNDAGEQQNWMRVAMPDANTLDFPDIASSQVPPWQRAESLEEVTRLGEQLAAMPDPRGAIASQRVSAGASRRRSGYGGLR